MNAVVESSCVAAHATDPWSCVFAEHVAPFIRTPFFALQAKFDAWQLPNILGSTDPKVINAYGKNVSDTLVANLLSRSGNAVVLDGCVHHCGGFNMYIVDNMTQAEAFSLWLKGGSAALPYHGQMGIRDNLIYPCTSCTCGF